MDDHFILEIDDILPEHACNEIIKRFESEPNKKQSRIGVGADNNGGILDLSSRNSKEICISDDPKWMNITKILYEAIYKSMHTYGKEVAKKIQTIGENVDFQMQFLIDNIKDSGLVIQRVEKDSWFRWHHDCTYNNRILNIIIYLNTLDEADGGRTEFIHGRKIFPKVGKILIFPTTWTNIHSGSWVKNKYKYICTTSFFKY